MCLLYIHVWLSAIKHSLEPGQHLGEILGKRSEIGQCWQSEYVHPHSL